MYKMIEMIFEKIKMIANLLRPKSAPQKSNWIRYFSRTKFIAFRISRYFWHETSP